MQLSYKINCSLKEYDKKVKTKTWEFPSYKEYCPICKKPDCSEGSGVYSRIVIQIDGVIIDLPIKRFICKTKNKTFSLLPNQLVPYSKYELSLMIKVTSTWEKFRGNIKKTLDNITVGDVCDEIYDIGVSHLNYFSNIFKLARRKYIIWQKTNLDYSLETFIRYCSNNRYCCAEVLNNKYYCGNGGYEANSQFLFGKASQFRHTKK